jgi:hypothetical protein
MGLDNGFIVKSNKRKITRDILPSGILYPFDTDYSDNPEIIYHRKDWGWRTDIMNTFGWRCKEPEEWRFPMEKPSQVLRMIELTTSWLDKERWDNEGESIWEYDEIKKILIRDISNLALIYGFMLNNPDVYLEFYDSY